MRPRYFVNVGDRLGRGVVIEPEVRVPEGNTCRRYARMRCDCGNTYLARLSDFGGSVRQPTRSCGCLKFDRTQAMGKSNATHGLHDHPLYDTWSTMVRRCTQPTNPKWHRYGGRGIRVCDRWLDVRAFVEDIEKMIGPRPEGMSLDRWPDNDGNYEPGNVRWATAGEQTANREYQLAMAFLTWVRAAHPEVVAEWEATL